MWDYEQNKWADEALGILGLSRWIERLPSVGSATEIAGRVTDEAARMTGLVAGTPVARGVYDIIACSLASGVTRTDQLSMIGGTFAIASTLHKCPAKDPLPNHQSVYPIGNLCLASTASATSGSNLEWVLTTFLAAEKSRSDPEIPFYDRINALVAEALERPNAITFLPYLFSDQPSGLIGARASDGLADVLRAVYEGVVCSHKQDLERLLDGPDAARPSSMRLAGGVSRSDVWAQMFADAFSMPVEIANGQEFGAKGAAMCAAAGIGAKADMEEAVDTMVRIERRFTPNDDRTDQFTYTYERFQHLRRALIATS